MSEKGHATPGDAALAHDHGYEGIPADRPGPGEPHTPLWLPLVGIGLMLSALLAYVMTRPAGKTSAELAMEAAPEASAAAPAAAAPADSAPPRPRRLPGLGNVLPQPTPPGSAPRPSMGALPAPRQVPAPAPTPNPPHGAPGHVH